ncbi:glycine betaine ABC transporter substrate-binding protein [Vibrio navarrensis]|uniref:glycine betaine/L-proline ABC transporter substrate-binding protein ProX n=1 Tax=Vibrio TaxID=662 RepID=UPI0005EDF88A|nr:MULTISPECIES: glycine betaine/L-proline ABC transporter substrate-binding protein ProX [Vibrio]KJR21230.1 glycine/betaine ABC transporter substrate-binding protein [Vibrio sp. S234-5]MBE3654037.1 glycine betaine ABC transporter substrate-binding protein [Vibrio navarrensis]MBE3662003.1 glycine betaine ABC transporter substrate-binding protein [Vibrio navarrensis]MBE4603896.1 glycine betaine ABC transporter substrate-binding protein [Vibrio navarrensis]
MYCSWKKTFTATALTSLALASSAWAEKLPGAGVTVQPVQSTVAEETFQTLIVNRALEALGYDVLPTKEVDYNVAYTSIAKGDATFLAVGWFPLHSDKYAMAGGDKVFYRQGQYISGAAQGYLIDKATADKYNISNISQLKDPKIARLFDANDDGKADLTGCNPGWGCEGVIEAQLSAYGLRHTVSHNQGNYAAIIADTISRYKQGSPILYYTWTPYWVSGVLVPGKDVVWLEVPFSALPGERKDVDTTLPNGKNYGFEMNSMRIVANKAFAEQNPAAAKLFAIMQVNINDVSAQNMMMSQGKNRSADIEAHVDGWIKAHQKQFDAWVEAAKKAAM